MRQRKITVRKYTGHPKYRFVVNFREADKRKRSFFETRAQADSFAAFKNAELRKYGMDGAEFPSRLREEARECAERLRQFGKVYDEAGKIIEPQTLKDATDFFIDYLKASKDSITAADLVPKFIAAKKSLGASKRYLQDLDYRLSRFAQEFDGQLVATITTAQIDDWLRSLGDLSPISRNNYRTVAIVLFNFAVKRGYATSNPAEKADEAKVIDSPPGILTVQQTAHLLETVSPELLPYAAIGAFAGLRRAELERLDWSEIDFESGLIEVTAKKAKARRRRFVTIQPNLREWLVPVRKHTGKVTPDNLAKQFEAMRTSAGIDDWPSNALRHSFASYHLAHFKNAATLALEMGHVDSNMIFDHYRELVKPKEAERYWNIRPAAKGKKVVAFAARA
jgi:integrase